MSVKNHYDNFLAPHYSWIYGGLENKIKDYSAWFQAQNITPVQKGHAIDLGAGSGFQSIPLARLGFKVTAIDTSSILLNELRENSKGLNIAIIEDDMLNFSVYSHLSPELIVCMGDTITHLPAIEDVNNLIKNSAELLGSKGTLIISYRDLSAELNDEARFIPVRSDENKIFTCFLEYRGDYVKVFDMVHTKEPGGWRQSISSYQKLRIRQHRMAAMMEEAGFHIGHTENNRGMLTLVGTKGLNNDGI